MTRQISNTTEIVRGPTAVWFFHCLINAGVRSCISSKEDKYQVSGITCQSLQSILDMKTKLNRSKDQSDIANIRKRLKLEDNNIDYELDCLLESIMYQIK